MKSPRGAQTNGCAVVTVGVEAPVPPKGACEAWAPAFGGEGTLSRCPQFAWYKGQQSHPVSSFLFFNLVAGPRVLLPGSRLLLSPLSPPHLSSNFLGDKNCVCQNKTYLFLFS